MLSEMTRGDNELEYELLLDVDVKSRKLTFLVDFFGSIISELSSESDFRIYKNGDVTILTHQWIMGHHEREELSLTPAGKVTN